MVQIQPTQKSNFKKPKLKRFVNPTHGSVWIVQIQPTLKAAVELLENPTHGSVWMVQIQPTQKSNFKHLLTVGTPFSEVRKLVRRVVVRLSKNVAAVLLQA